MSCNNQLHSNWPFLSKSTYEYTIVYYTIARFAFTSCGRQTHQRPPCSQIPLLSTESVFHFAETATASVLMKLCRFWDTTGRLSILVLICLALKPTDQRLLHTIMGAGWSKYLRNHTWPWVGLGGFLLSRKNYPLDWKKRQWQCVGVFLETLQFYRRSHSLNSNSIGTVLQGPSILCRNSLSMFFLSIMAASLFNLEHRKDSKAHPSVAARSLQDGPWEALVWRGS